MAQTQKTIRFNKKSEEIIAQVSPQEESNYNFAVNQIIHRYSVLCDHLKSDLTKKEWNAIKQAYDNHLFNSDIELEAKAFIRHLKEFKQFNDDGKSVINSPESMKKFEAFSIPEIIAVFQAIHELKNPHTNK